MSERNFNMGKRLLTLNGLPEDVSKLVGELILLFGAVEWVIANILLLKEVGPIEYQKIKDMEITQRYFETLLSMGFRYKLERLEGLGYDTSVLKNVSDYRNTLTHGLIFNRPAGLTIKAIAKPESNHKDLTVSEISTNLEKLQIEGGNLLEFLDKS